MVPTSSSSKMAKGSSARVSLQGQDFRVPSSQKTKVGTIYRAIRARLGDLLALLNPKDIEKP